MHKISSLLIYQSLKLKKTFNIQWLLNIVHIFIFDLHNINECQRLYGIFSHSIKNTNTSKWLEFTLQPIRSEYAGTHLNS